MLPDVGGSFTDPSTRRRAPQRRVSMMLPADRPFGTCPHASFGSSKNTPLRSRPIVAPTLRAGFGSSDSNEKPFWMDDHLIVDPVLMNPPRNCCISLTTMARLISPLHSTSNETVAGAGATGGMVNVGVTIP